VVWQTLVTQRLVVQVEGRIARNNILLDSYSEPGMSKLEFAGQWNLYSILDGKLLFYAKLLTFNVLLLSL
jgi:hypothetical protein